MRSQVWDKAEKKLYCLKAISQAELMVDRRYVLVRIVERNIDLDPEEESRFRELVRERGKEVLEMAVTWEEALAEREAKGKALGLTEGKALGLTEGKALGLVEGKLEAARQAIVLLAQHRFGKSPHGWTEKLRGIDDLGLLYEILEKVPDARSFEELI